MKAPLPWLPRLGGGPGSTVRTLEPRLAKRWLILWLVPSVCVTVVITAATPIITPSMVRNERVPFAMSALSAALKFAFSSRPRWTSCRGFSWTDVTTRGGVAMLLVPISVFLSLLYFLSLNGLIAHEESIFKLHYPLCNSGNIYAVRYDDQRDAVRI